MISCEGYKMFKGTMRIIPNNPNFPCKEEFGVWLYKPDCKCWYCNGSSYPDEVCEVIEDRIE